VLIMYDNRIFEVLKIEQQDKVYSFAGRLFHTIKVGDQLIAGDYTMTQFCLLTVKDIITYGRHFQQLDKGDTGWLIVDIHSESKLDFTQIKYLYKGIEDDNYIQLTSWKYLTQDADFTFKISLVTRPDNVYNITGTAVQLLQIGDKLTTVKEVQPQSPIFIIKNIIVSLQDKDFYLQEIQRGETGTIIVNKTSDIDFSQIEYLYMAT